MKTFTFEHFNQLLEVFFCSFQAAVDCGMSGLIVLLVRTHYLCTDRQTDQMTFVAIVYVAGALQMLFGKYNNCILQIHQQWTALLLPGFFAIHSVLLLYCI